jgi:hypothetical protein
MKPLARRYLELTPEQQRRVHLRLCERALEAWESHVAREGETVYIDSVVGMRHVVDAALPRLALAAAREGEDRGGIAHRYLEPITALQDDDLEFPGQVEMAYYALYNLFEKYALGAEVDGWLIANQALASLDEAQWETAFADAVWWATNS